MKYSWVLLVLGAPEIPKAVGRKLGIAYRVLDIFVSELGLQRPGVVAGVGQRVAAAMPEHVRVDQSRAGTSQDATKAAIRRVANRCAT
jgi:hypothetical protein